MPNSIVTAEKFKCYWCLFENFERFTFFKMHSCICTHAENTNQLEYFYSKPHILISIAIITLNLISFIYHLKQILFEEYDDLHVVYTTTAFCGGTIALLIFLKSKQKLITITFTTDILHWKETLITIEDNKSVKRKVTFLGYLMVFYTGFLFLAYLCIYCNLNPVDFFGNVTVIVFLYTLQCAVFHCESAWFLADISYKTFRDELADILQENLLYLPTDKNIIITVRNFSVLYSGKAKLVKAYCDLYLPTVMFGVAFLPFVITFSLTYFLKVFLSFPSLGIEVIAYNSFFLMEFVLLLLMFCNVLRDFHVLLHPVSFLRKVFDFK